MEYSMQKLEKSRYELAVSVEEEEWDACIKEAYAKNKHKYRVEGFRPGKVPYNVIANRFGKQAFYEDALDVALTKYYGEILDKEKEGFEPVGRPDVDIQDVSDEGVKFVITVAVYPEVKVAAYKGLTVPAESAEVTEEDILKEMRADIDKASRWVDVTDRAAQKGDKVIIDYSGSVDGVKFDGGTAEKQTLDLGSGMFIPGFEEQVEGMKIGESKDLNVSFPAEYQAEELAGKAAVFAVTLHEIKVKEEPALDDEFAKDLGEYDTFAEYKAALTAKLTQNAEKAARYKEDDAIINMITDATEIDMPDAMVEEELDHSIDDFKMNLSRYGMKIEDFFKYSGGSIEQMRDERREDSARKVKVRLVLEAIIKAEEIKVGKEDLDARIEADAAKEEKSVEDYRKSLNEYDIGRMMNEILADKLFAFLRENNTFA